ncbi:MAG: CU044_5270 family protein [Solirubrobacteraceae bacterium]
MLDELERELERVRGYRADVPEPDADAVAAARVVLMEAITCEPKASASRRHLSEQRFFVSLLHHDEAQTQRNAWERRAGPARSRERLRRVQRRRRLALAGGLAAVGVGAAGVLGLSTATTPVSALAAQMNQLAKVAASQAWTGIPGPGQYLYTESEGLTSAGTYLNGRSCTVSQVEHRRSWIATDGSGAIDDVLDQSKFTSAAEQIACAALGITDPGSQNSSSSNRFPAGGLSFPTNDWKSLSTDPATLLEQVHERDGGPDTPAEWFTNVADFMRESDVPPAIRAALYQATALIPGVKLLGQQTDPPGQTGLGVAYYADGEPTHELIFDQQSGRLLAEEYFDTTGKITDWSAYTEQKIVDSVPSYPMNPAGPSSASSAPSTTSTTQQGQPTTPTSATGTASTPSNAPSTTPSNAPSTTPTSD